MFPRDFLTFDHKGEGSLSLNSTQIIILVLFCVLIAKDEICDDRSKSILI